MGPTNRRHPAFFLLHGRVIREKGGGVSVFSDTEHYQIKGGKGLAAARGIGICIRSGGGLKEFTEDLLVGFCRILGRLYLRRYTMNVLGGNGYF